MTLYKCGTNLHEDVSGTNVSFSPHAARMLEHVHFTHVWCAVYVDEPSDVLVSKVTKERDLAQDAFGERNLLQCTGDHFDSHGFPGYLVHGGSEYELNGRDWFQTKRYAHYESICSRTQLADELPPFLDMKDLAE